MKIQWNSLVVPVILQQLWATRSLQGISLRRSCESLQMPPHRNVLPAHSRPGDVVIVMEHAFLVCKNQPMNAACHNCFHILCNYKNSNSGITLQVILNYFN